MSKNVKLDIKKTNFHEFNYEFSRITNAVFRIIVIRAYSFYIRKNSYIKI